MAFIRGSKATITYNSVALTNFVNQFSMSRESQLIDIQTLGNTFAEVQQNLKSARITMSGFFDTGSSNTPDTVLSAALLAGTSASLVITYVGATTRTITWAGARVASYEITAVTDNLVAWSAEIQTTTVGTYS
ncbi:MAG: hypothetical protein ACO3EZ_03295 [Prochlorotrichaceae cyanobacterium]